MIAVVDEDQWRLKRFLEILREVDQRLLQRALHTQQAARAHGNDIGDEADRRLLQRQRAKRTKRYNLTQTATCVGISRQGFYNWIKRGWVTPKRDYRGYPVFTVVDIVRIKRWCDTVQEGSSRQVACRDP